MSEMVERVAARLKGFVAAEMLETGSVNPQRWEAMARAAIEAMREPTPKMLRLGGDAVYSECGTGTAIDDRQAKASWVAMIDAALK